MKREGRQHGMVRTYFYLPNPSNDRCPRTRRLISNFESPATAGIFTRVSSKPTNHSKFTGKCGRPRCSGCHSRPVSKSRDKSKGAQKLRSHGVDLNFNFHGYSYSASTILDELMAPTHYLGKDYRDLDCMGDSVVGPELNYAIDDVAQNDHPEIDHIYHGIDGIETLVDDEEGDNEDDDISFIDVGFAWDAVDGDEGWSIVGEMW